MHETEPRGVLDTCVYIDLQDVELDLLPDVPELTAVTMTELHQGIAMARSSSQRAVRLEKLSAAVADFEPLPYDGEAASRFGTLAALVLSQGRSPKPRQMDLMIAAIASVHEIPLYTRNPDDFLGLESTLRVVAV
ncbi:type II toxin-antitoxin system VapC family toxin [Glycomyces xiaoerkulensis]|uniref:type II toxin-antitoxin system VapC family toxin n=1 Tax=Glycomyces xiaoerkulensis TaxID=2038139 RepID=UPI000C257C99